MSIRSSKLLNLCCFVGNKSPTILLFSHYVSFALINVYLFFYCSGELLLEKGFKNRDAMFLVYYSLSFCPYLAVCLHKRRLSFWLHLSELIWLCMHLAHLALASQYCGNCITVKHYHILAERKQKAIEMNQPKL